MEKMVESLDIAHRAVDIAADQQAADIRLLDIKAFRAFAEYFVVLSAESARQMNTVLEEIEAGIGKLGAKAHHREGTAESGWVLLDYGDVLVHVFAPAQREYFDLEGLWGAARTLIQIQ